MGGANVFEQAAISVVKSAIYARAAVRGGQNRDFRSLISISVLGPPRGLLCDLQTTGATSMGWTPGWNKI